MVPTSRHLGSITRPRDLRAITRPRGGSVDALKVGQSLSSDKTTPSEHFQESDSLQVLSRSRAGRMPKDSVEPGSPCMNTEAPLSGSVRPHSDASLLACATPPLSFPSQHIRGFHTSPRVSYDSTSYNANDVPDFFIKYKQQRAISSTASVAHEHKQEELGLMQSLTDLTLSGDVVASTRRLKAKTPVEHHVANGHVVHPSGFVVPGPGHSSTSDVARAKEKERNELKERLVQTAAVANRVLESDFEQVDATTLPSLHKVPFEVRELDGTVKHPSGFVPPTPAHKFRYPVNSSGLWERKVSPVRQKIRQPSSPRVALRAMHTPATPEASGDV